MEKNLIAILLVVLIIAISFIVYNYYFSLPEYDEEIEIDGEKYRLMFYDDFNGEKLNKRLWSLCPEQKRQDIGGRWDDSMVSLDGEGNLVIKADIKNGTPISGAVRTKGKFEQAKGYFEIRCRLQKERGFWGAFWLMCDSMKKVGKGAKDGAEIDIFESYSVDGHINHAIHWDGYGKNHKGLAKDIYAPECYDGDFHTFALLWTDTEYVFYIDGKETYRIGEGDEGFPGSCTKKTYLKITSEFGSWAGAYNKNALPDDILVDYVKVYKKVG